MEQKSVGQVSEAVLGLDGREGMRTDQYREQQLVTEHSNAAAFTTSSNATVETSKGEESEIDALGDVENDFGDLAALYSPLSSFLIPIHDKGSPKPRYRLDWRCPEAVARLTEALLFARFNIRAAVPTDQLIPAIPLRLNYIIWIEQLMSLSSANKGQLERPVLGVDVGCGPLAIYALIGAARNPQWYFVCSDIDSGSLERAQANVALNATVGSRISFKLQTDASHILRNVLDARDTSPVDFCMFNPPFFGALEEKKERVDTACTATPSELVHGDGGEMALFLSLLHESMMPEFQLRLTWFTFMFGMKKHLKSAVSILQEKNVPFVVKKSFIQGKTHRWAAGWSFQPWLASRSFHAPQIPSTTLPPPKRRKLNEAANSKNLPRFKDIVVHGLSLVAAFERIFRSVTQLDNVIFLKKDPSFTSVEFVQSRLDDASSMRVLMPVRVELVAPPARLVHQRNTTAPSLTVKLNVVPNLAKRESASRNLAMVAEPEMLNAFSVFADAISAALQSTI
jgi:U6 snRNA m6A methyltransferase